MKISKSQSKVIEDIEYDIYKNSFIIKHKYLIRILRAAIDNDKVFILELVTTLKELVNEQIHEKGGEHVKIKTQSH